MNIFESLNAALLQLLATRFIDNANESLYRVASDCEETA